MHDNAADRFDAAQERTARRTSVRPAFRYPHALALAASHARLNMRDAGLGDEDSAPMDDETFVAWHELAEVLRGIHERLLSEGINLLEGDPLRSTEHHEE